MTTLKASQHDALQRVVDRRLPISATRIVQCGKTRTLEIMKRIATLRSWRGDRGAPVARFFVTFALLAFTSISFSQSSGEAKAAKSKVEQRGTEDLPFVVRPPKKTEAEAKKE